MESVQKSQVFHLHEREHNLKRIEKFLCSQGGWGVVGGGGQTDTQVHRSYFSLRSLLSQLKLTSGSAAETWLEGKSFRSESVAAGEGGQGRGGKGGWKCRRRRTWRKSQRSAFHSPEEVKLINAAGFHGMEIGQL